MQPPDTIAGAEAGLTLIEMIVALAIGALVVGFLAQGSTMIRTFARLGAAVSVQDETLAVRDHLRQVVGSALNGGSGPQRMGFAGVGDTIVFTAPGDRLLESGGPVRITLTVLPDGPGVALAEARAPVGGGKEQTRRLLAGASRIAFSYFGAGSGDTVARWSSEWTDPETSPRLVRIDVAFPKGDARRWPTFVVFLPTTRDPAASTSPAQTAAAGSPQTAAQASRYSAKSGGSRPATRVSAASFRISAPSGIRP